jgi:hypothetical protein
MRTPRDRRESPQIDVSPQLQACPTCHPARQERYHKQRGIVRLDQQVTVVSHVLEWRKTACTRQAVIDRPQQEEALAWRGDTFGLDVVARIGE